MLQGGGGFRHIVMGVGMDVLVMGNDGWVRMGSDDVRAVMDGAVFSGMMGESKYHLRK